MRFGLALPHYGYSMPGGEPVSYERVAGFAVLAERLGFDSVWVSDHFYLSIAKYGGGETLHDVLEPLTTLAGLAAATERVRLGTLVLCTLFRHPAVLAKAAATLDAFADGRVDIGLGAGWYEPEFADFGYEFPGTRRRFDMLEETLQVLDLLFGEGLADFAGRYYSLVGAQCLPHSPQQPRLPVWVGAKGGPRALRLAARHAGGWNASWRWTPESYGEKARLADRICEQESRDPATLRRSVGLYALVGENERDLVERYRALQRWTPNGALDGEPLDEWMRDTLTGTPERVLGLLAEYSAFGVEEVVVNVASMPFAVFDPAAVELFAEEILRPARDL